MDEVTLWEKIVLNRYTPMAAPLEILVKSIPYLRNFVARFEISVPNQNPFAHRIESYRKLIKALENGRYDKAKKYTRTICGIAQLRLAQDRGLLTEQQYRGLFKNSSAQH